MAITKEEQDWRASDDARILMQAEQIKRDAARRKRAIQKVSQIEKEAENVIKTAKTVKKPTPRKPTRRK